MESKLSLGWKAWFAVCAVLGLAGLGLIAWTVVTVVNWLVTK